MKKTVVIAIVIILVVLAGFRLMSNHAAINSKKQSSNVSTKGIPVNVQEVKNMKIDKEINVEGSLIPYSEVTIASETQGKITSLNFELGQSKPKGAIIATIDNKLKLLAVQSAKISLDELKKNYERSLNLFKGGTMTEQALDQIRSNYENAQVGLDQAQKQLSYSKIVSPFNGVITQKLTDLGAYVAPGTGIATIVDISRLKVKLNVSETDAYLLKLGDKAQIMSDVYPGKVFEGKISFISAKGDDAHNYPVEIAISNNKQNPLKAGTFVTAKIVIPAKEAHLYIPREALLGSSKDASVYVSENGVAKIRQIVTGTENNNYIEVKSGLKEGDIVVTTGQVNLEDNKPIIIK